MRRGLRRRRRRRHWGHRGHRGRGRGRGRSRSSHSSRCCRRRWQHSSTPLIHGHRHAVRCAHGHARRWDVAAEDWVIIGPRIGRTRRDGLARRRGLADPADAPADIAAIAAPACGDWLLQPKGGGRRRSRLRDGGGRGCTALVRASRCWRPPARLAAATDGGAANLAANLGRRHGRWCGDCVREGVRRKRDAALLASRGEHGARLTKGVQGQGAVANKLLELLDRCGWQLCSEARGRAVSTRVSRRHSAASDTPLTLGSRPSECRCAAW